MTELEHLTLSNCLPTDDVPALLVGRVWIPGPAGGPAPCLVLGDDVFDLTGVAPTMSWLLDREDLVQVLNAGSDLQRLGAASEALRNSHHSLASPDALHFLPPCDLQAVKACGVTFVISLLERVIEEQARGDKSRADELRAELGAIVGDDLSSVRPGSEEAERLKQALIEKGAWSQYLEVGIGPLPEIFTKCPPMASVGIGAEIGVRRDSAWNNPEPEIVLAVNGSGAIVGASVGNDVNHRDFEGRSALLLSESKDNTASSTIGPFIRLFDDGFSLDDVRSDHVTLTVTGEDGYEVEGGSSISQIARDPADLAGHACGANHQYPDGFMLYLGTMYAPVQDRGGAGQGFTHKVGDRVEISTPKLGKLINWVNLTDQVPHWTFGTGALMRNLAGRGLLT